MYHPWMLPVNRKNDSRLLNSTNPARIQFKLIDMVKKSVDSLACSPQHFKEKVDVFRLVV
jgi:hypothetical protein